MRNIIAITVCVIVALCVWRVASIISPDAVSMAIGFLFGILSSLPVTLLALSGNRQRADVAPVRDVQPPAPVVVLYSNRTQNVYLAGDDEPLDVVPDLRQKAIIPRR